jgi:Ni/Co efflux regulator RcnB
MSSKQMLAIAIALSFVGVPFALAATPANAASAGQSAAGSAYQVREAKDKDKKDEDEHENHVGHEDSDDDSWGHEDNHSIPPLVIRPHEDADHNAADDEGFVLPSDPTAVASPATSDRAQQDYINAGGATYSVSPLAPTLGGSTDPLGSGLLPTSGDSNRLTVNPEAAPAIDPASIRTSSKTPADVFMESATWGLMAMGAGAVALGSVAGVKTLSARRKPNGEYFYDGEN